jgi:hypothetical protein
VRLLLILCLARAQAPEGAAAGASVTAPPAEGDAPTISVTDALAEGAALNLGEAARQLARTGGSVGAAGRVGQLSALRSDAAEVVQRAEQLVRLASEAEGG